MCVLLKNKMRTLNMIDVTKQHIELFIVAFRGKRLFIIYKPPSLVAWWFFYFDRLCLKSYPFSIMKIERKDGHEAGCMYMRGRNQRANTRVKTSLLGNCCQLKNAFIHTGYRMPFPMSCV